MRILVFGTGSSTTLYLKTGKEYFKNIEILAFIDNNKEKCGKLFCEKEVISPQDIYKYTYNAILICSVYEEEIYEQLVSEINIFREKVYTRRDFFEQFVFPWYDEKYDLYNKKILIVTENHGTNKEYKKYFGMCFDILHVIGIIAIDEIYLLENYDYDYIFLTNFKYPSDQSEVCMKESISLIANIIRNQHIILSKEIVDVYFIAIKEVQYGKKYKDKKFLVIRPYSHRMGLGAIALIVARSITYAKKKGYISVVDMQFQQNQYLENNEYGKINAYTKFFEQPCGYDLDDIKNAKSVSYMYGERWFSKKEEYELCLPKMNAELNEKYYEFKKRFNNKKVLGVLFRGTDYANLKPFGHAIQPDLYSMLQKVKEKISEWGEFDLIFLCTEVEEACKEFEDEFGINKVCYYPQLRYKLKTKEYLSDIILDKGEHTKQGKAYWIALNCLASCDSIVACQCTGTEIALIINGHQYQNKYLFKLGKYGIDDI